MGSNVAAEPRAAGGGSIVISRLQEIDRFISDAVDQPVFLSNASRPTTSQHVFQRLGFSQAFKRIPHDRLNKIEDSDRDAALVPDPKP